MEVHLTIAEVAERTGLTAHTLRYYERIGLIAAVSRAPGGQRRYASADLDWLAFLLRLRETGMPIQGMQAFARLRSQGGRQRQRTARGARAALCRSPGQGGGTAAIHAGACAQDRALPRDRSQCEAALASSVIGHCPGKKDER